MKGLFVKHRTWLTIVLALLGMGDMVYYSWCETTCSFLKGDVFGIDLKHIGIFFMLVLSVLALVRPFDLIRLLLAGAIGGEVVLMAFQVREDVFCPFCLAFGAIILLLYALHYERPPQKANLALKVLYAPGEAKLPILNIRMPLLVVMLIGWLFMAVAFEGTATPTYDTAALPSGEPTRQTIGLAAGSRHLQKGNVTGPSAPLESAIQPA